MYVYGFSGLAWVGLRPFQGQECFSHLPSRLGHLGSKGSRGYTLEIRTGTASLEVFWTSILAGSYKLSTAVGRKDCCFIILCSFYAPGLCFTLASLLLTDLATATRTQTLAPRSQVLGACRAPPQP